MYKIVVGNISRKRKENWKLEDHNPYSVWDGSPLAAQNCRISALSSADYLLRERVDVDWGSVAWKGTKEEITRLFRAEELDEQPLLPLQSGCDYAVIFIEFCWMTRACG